MEREGLRDGLRLREAVATELVRGCRGAWVHTPGAAHKRAPSCCPTPAARMCARSPAARQQVEASQAARTHGDAQAQGRDVQQQQVGHLAVLLPAQDGGLMAGGGWVGLGWDGWGGTTAKASDGRKEGRRCLLERHAPVTMAALP